MLLVRGVWVGGGEEGRRRVVLMQLVVRYLRSESWGGIEGRKGEDEEEGTGHVRDATPRLTPQSKRNAANGPRFRRVIGVACDVCMGSLLDFGALKKE